VRPNPSLEATATGKALGPRASQCHHPSRGPSAFPASAPQLKRCTTKPDQVCVTNSSKPCRRQVSIGGLSKTELIERLATAGIEMNSIALAMLEDDSFRMQEQPATFEVELRTLNELGLPDGGTLAQAIDAATALGFGLCPRELGPYLRLAYMDQEEGSVGYEATRHQAPPGSITVVDQRPKEDESEYQGLYLRRIEGKLWLRGYRSWSGHLWQPQDTLVFTTARSAA